MTSDVDPQIIVLGLTVKDLLIAGGWFFTIVGWIVSNAQANKRERRKEVRSEIDACIKLIADLVVKCRSYYALPASSAESKPKAAEIRFELQRLITRVERVESKYAQFDAIGACGELLESISGDPFESANREVLAADSDLLLKIESDTHVLIDQLEVGFVKKFG